MAQHVFTPQDLKKQVDYDLYGQFEDIRPHFQGTLPFDFRWVELNPQHNDYTITAICHEDRRFLETREHLAFGLGDSTYVADEYILNIKGTETHIPSVGHIPDATAFLEVAEQFHKKGMISDEQLTELVIFGFSVARIYSPGVTQAA
jgi:hypothetical protein